VYAYNSYNASHSFAASDDLSIENEISYQFLNANNNNYNSSSNNNNNHGSGSGNGNNDSATNVKVTRLSTSLALVDDLDRLRLSGRSKSISSAASMSNSYMTDYDAITASQSFGGMGMGIAKPASVHVHASKANGNGHGHGNRNKLSGSTNTHASTNGLSVGLSNSFTSHGGSMVGMGTSTGTNVGNININNNAFLSGNNGNDNGNDNNANDNDHHQFHPGVATSYSFSSVGTGPMNMNVNMSMNTNDTNKLHQKHNDFHASNNTAISSSTQIMSNANHNSIHQHHHQQQQSQHHRHHNRNTTNMNTNNSMNNPNNPNAITSIIHDAARITDWTSVNNLAQTHPSSAKYKCPDGLTPIHHACSRRCPYPSVFHNLIKANPDALTEIDEKGWTPLHYACRFKAPMEGVRLLLHLYKDRGYYAARLRCREKGRTPLYYAIRYDAPEGVVELLLNSMSQSDVLDGDREGKSALGLVWNTYVNSLEGQRVIAFYNKILKKWEAEEMPWEDRVEASKKLRSMMKGKLKDCWKKANMLLRGAFKFSLSTNNECDDGYEPTLKSDGTPRKWRVLHAAVSIRCHSSLALMACVLHPEQIREIDDQDLFGSGACSFSSSSNINDNGNDKFTALHLASKSQMSGKDSRVVLSHVLEMYPEAAAIPNPADNSFPLHYLCENASKVHWVKDILPIYNAYKQAALEQDSNGRTPLHRATTICESRGIPPPPFGTPTSTSNANTNAAPGLRTQSSSNDSVASHSTLLRTVDPAGSIIQNILALHSEVASVADVFGKLPLHSIAELGETWDANVQCLYDIYPAALSTRTNRQSSSNLPVHLVASNPDAKSDLISKIVELHPRGTSIVNGEGKLPLHLACESGKSFEGGLEDIYEAFPNAITIAEDNERRWMPLHFMITCPNSSIELIEKVMDLYPDAVNVLDGENKSVLHLAVESGKDWDGGIQKLFEANPDAIQMEDNEGRIPLVAALLTYCDGKNRSTVANETYSVQVDDTESKPSEETMLTSSSEEEVIQQVDSGDSEDILIGPHLAQVNVLYHLLKAAPHVLHRG